MTNRSQLSVAYSRCRHHSITNCEGKNALIIEEKLGQHGLVGHFDSCYKAGHLPPDPRTVRDFGRGVHSSGFSWPGVATAVSRCG